MKKIDVEKILDIAFECIESGEFGRSMKLIEAVEHDGESDFRISEAKIKTKTKNYTYPADVTGYMEEIRANAPKEEYERIRADYLDYLNRVEKAESPYEAVYKSDTRLLERVNREFVFEVIMGIFAVFACIGIGSSYENKLWYGAAAAIAVSVAFSMYRAGALKNDLIESIEENKKKMEEYESGKTLGLGKID